MRAGVESLDDLADIPVGKGSTSKVAMHDTTPVLVILVAGFVPAILVDGGEFETAGRNVVEVVFFVAGRGKLDLICLIKIEKSARGGPGIVRTPESVNHEEGFGVGGGEMLDGRVGGFYVREIGVRFVPFLNAEEFAADLRGFIGKGAEASVGRGFVVPLVSVAFGRKRGVE